MIAAAQAALGQAGWGAMLGTLANQAQGGGPAGDGTQGNMQMQPNMQVRCATAQIVQCPPEQTGTCRF